MNPRLFSFYSIGKGWMTLYPQKYLLVVVQSTAILCKGLTVVYLTLLVNHNFAERKSGLCSLTEIMMDIRSESKNTCYFEIKVTLLLLIYVSVYYACILMVIISVLPFVYEHSMKNTLRGIESLRSRIKYVLVFLRNICWMYVMNFVVQHRHFMLDFTNHLPNIGWTAWKVKATPSILNALGTVAFTVIFYLKGESGFSNIHLGISPLRLVLIGLGIELIHFISLQLMIYRADPQHVQTLSNEKIVDYLIKKGKINPDIDVTCSRTAKEILHDVLVNKSDLSVYKEDIKLEMIGYSRVLPPETRLKGVAEFHRTFAEAIRKYSRANGNNIRGYTSLNQDVNLPEEEVSEKGRKEEKIRDVELVVIVETELSKEIRDAEVVDVDTDSSNEPKDFRHADIAGEARSLKEAGDVEVKVEDAGSLKDAEQ